MKSYKLDLNLKGPFEHNFGQIAKKALLLLTLTVMPWQG